MEVRNWRETGRRRRTRDGKDRRRKRRRRRRRRDGKDNTVFPPSLEYRAATFRCWVEI